MSYKLDLNTAKIFIVDDEPEITEIVETFLSEHGFQVLTENNPSQAVEKAKKMVSENPIVEKAEEVKNKIQKEVSSNKLVKKAEKMSLKLKKDITDTIEDVIEDVNEKVSEIIGDNKTTTKKATAKKTAGKKAVTKKVSILKSSTKNDLKVIKGIGPKLEETLNSVGFNSFEQLAKMTIKDITIVLSDAGVNAKMYDISGWKAQSKLAFKGDMEAVKNWVKK